MTENEKTSTVQIARCEEHGLAYNALEADGCVRCLRERGNPNESVTGPKLGNQLLVALALVVVTGASFFFVHRSVAMSLNDMFGLGVGSAEAERERAASDAEVMIILLAEPDLMSEVERDPELRRAFEEKDMEVLREFLEEKGYFDEEYPGEAHGAYEHYDPTYSEDEYATGEYY